MMIGRLPGTIPDRPETSQNLPGELPRSPRPLRGPSRTPRTSWEHVQAPHLSRQSVPGQLIDHVVGFGDRPTSPGVGLGGVTCSGFGSAASAEGLSIRRIQRIHGVYGGIRSSTGSLGRFTSPYPSAGSAHAAGLTRRLLLEPAGSNRGLPENHRFRYYTSARAT